MNARMCRPMALFSVTARVLLLACFVQAGTWARAQNASRWPKLEEVIVVSKTHFDIGFTDLASRVVDRYRTSMADQALKLVDESRGLPPDRQFAWTLAGWPMAQVLWPGQTAERRERFVAAMRAGRLVPHALAFTTHTESLDLEDLTRGFRFSVEMARLAGQPLPDRLQDDRRARPYPRAGHGSGQRGREVLPPRLQRQLLARRRSGAVLVGGAGRLAGPDDVLPDLRLGPLPARRLAAQDLAVHVDDLRQPRPAQHPGGRGPVRPGQAGLAGRAGPLRPAVGLRRRHPAREAGPAGRPRRHAGHVDPRHRVDADRDPVGARHPAADRGPGVARHAAGGVGRARPSRSAPIVRDAYENTLLFGEHTWGPDVARYAGYSYGDEWKKKLAAGQYRFLLEGFNQKRAYAHRAAELVEPAIRQRMAALAAAVDVPGRRIVVFNPLPWTRDGAVEVPWTGPTTALTDAGQPRDGRRPVGTEHCCGSWPGTCRRLGYRTFVPAEGEAGQETTTGREEKRSRPTPKRSASRTSCSA